MQRLKMSHKRYVPKHVTKLSDAAASLLNLLGMFGMDLKINIKDFRAFILDHRSAKQRAIMQRAVVDGEMLCEMCGTEASWVGCDNPACAETILRKARK